MTVTCSSGRLAVWRRPDRNVFNNPFLRQEVSFDVTFLFFDWMDPKFFGVVLTYDQTLSSQANVRRQHYWLKQLVKRRPLHIQFQTLLYRSCSRSPSQLSKPARPLSVLQRPRHTVFGSADCLMRGSERASLTQRNPLQPNAMRCRNAESSEQSGGPVSEYP